MAKSKPIWILSCATLVLAVALAVLAPHHENIRQPILALQLARNWAELVIVLTVGEAGRARFWQHTQLDFVFIAAYTSLFVLVAFHVARGHWRWMVAGLVLAAGVADVCENFAILSVLPLERGFDNDMAQNIRQWALTKWSLLGVVWLALGVAQYRTPVPGILYAVAGALALWGCLDHRGLEVAVVPLAGALVWQAWAYFPAKATASLKSRSTASGSSVR